VIHDVYGDVPDYIYMVVGVNAFNEEILGLFYDYIDAIDLRDNYDGDSDFEYIAVRKMEVK